MDLPKGIITVRCTILGTDQGYWERITYELEDFHRFIFTYAHTREDMVGFVYEYEPMLILMEMTPENIGIATYMAGLSKYRLAFTVGMCEGNVKSFKKFEDHKLVSTLLTKSGEDRKDAMSIMRKYKRYYRYGCNLKSLTEKMPIVNDICWHDPSWDERSTWDHISNKLDKLGVRKELEGHRYLIAAIAIQSAVRDVPEPSKLYSNIADYYETTPSAVEKAIRYAIETAWMTGDIEMQHKVFGMTVDEEKGKPTNSEFIARLALDDQWR